MAAECSFPQLVVGDTKRGWGKHLSKGLLLIGGGEQIISLALVIFQGTWQELLGDISSYLAGDKSFTFQLRFPTDKITSTEVINTDVISVMRTASTKIFQVCAISGLAKKKKKSNRILCIADVVWRHLHPAMFTKSVRCFCFPKLSTLAWAGSHRRKEHVELNTEENLVYQCSEGSLLGFQSQNSWSELLWGIQKIHFNAIECFIPSYFTEIKLHCHLFSFLSLWLVLSVLYLQE